MKNLDEDEFISNIFIRPKKNGKQRVILNLKRLNNCVEYHHFKMDTLKTAISLISKDCYMASIDLQDAYYSCKVNVNDRKYLRFFWNGQKYQYTCLAMGLASAPRIFTKLMKPVFSTLRKQGFSNIAYIDDTLLVSDSETECAENVKNYRQITGQSRVNRKYREVYFHPFKGNTVLGFIINSNTMTVSLTYDRAESIRQMCQQILASQSIVITQLAQMIGKLVATC